MSERSKEDVVGRREGETKEEEGGIIAKKENA